MRIKTQTKQTPTYYYYRSLRSSVRRKYDYQQPSKRFKLPVKTAFATFIILLNIGVGWHFSGLSGENQNSKVASVKAAAITKPVPPINEARLSSEINAIIAANPQLDIGVAVTDLKTNKSYSYGVDNVFIAASVGKLLSATLYLHQVESGQRSLSEMVAGSPARVQLEKMISKSDNPSWKAINDLVGHPALQAYAKEQGFRSYNAETNTITASEVNELLTNLHQQKLLNQSNTRLVLSHMKTSQEEMQFIRNHIAPSVAVYHKAGWLSDRAHDTAIIENGDRPYTLVIFTKSRKGDYDFVKGQTIFAGLTKSTNGVLSETL